MYAPSHHRQAAIAFPWSSMATRGAYALLIGSEAVSGADQVPEIVREDERTTERRLRIATQTTVARPASTATSALKASSPGAERS
jgi:hypothetical protein